MVGFGWIGFDDNGSPLADSRSVAQSLVVDHELFLQLLTKSISHHSRSLECGDQ